MRKIESFVAVIALILIVAGCATGQQLIRNNAYDYKISRTFNSDFETTWSVIIKVMEAHPITNIEKDSGILFNIEGEKINIKIRKILP